ncbi:GspE/PulE family protein [Patescibacteria group bacterium]
MAFLDNLADKGIIKQGDVESISRKSEKEGIGIDEILQESGVKPDEMLRLKSEYFNIPVKPDGEIEVSFSVLEYVPEESSAYYKFIPLGVEDGVLEVGVLNPEIEGLRDAIGFIATKLNVPYKMFLISSVSFDKVAEQYGGLKGEVTKALSELETELVSDKDMFSPRKMEDVSAEKVVADANAGKTQIIEDAPVTKIVAVILRHAIEGRASDVHIEPMAQKIRVRFRVDGVMYTSLTLPISVSNAVVARIKILTKTMKLDEKRKPQDGRFSARIEGRKVDFRVSTFPTYYGEKVVMRILDPEKGVKVLEKLGISDENTAAIREALGRPYGLILLTGPTGSGKTTTLYSMVNELGRDEKNVVSLEDPVEYNIEGMSQSQVRPEIGYTFASGLRSILRQDPDVIMVGEIRDKETAQLAIQAALTGHLVLATLHTNNAAGVIPRLVDMGVDPFLIAPTLILAIAQRLVRRLCDDSGKAVPVADSIKLIIDKQIADLPEDKKQAFLSAKEVYEAEPTATCSTGTRGRIGVYEVLKIDKDIERAILTNPVEDEIYKIARDKGMLTMKEDAFLKTFKKEIPFEDVNKL